MKKFYMRLRTSEDPLLRPLQQLTRCSLAEVNAVKCELLWEIWGVD